MIQFLIFFVSWNAGAEPPRPLPKKYVQSVPHSACPDQIEEKDEQLFLTRSKCKKIKPQPIGREVPAPTNAIETEFLIYRGKLFESSMDPQQPLVAFCILENPKTSVKSVLRKSGNAYWLGVSDRSEHSYRWSAVQAVKSGTVYTGKGDLNPNDIISLSLQSGTATIQYTFEYGKGAIGQRPQVKGDYKNLRCY